MTHRLTDSPACLVAGEHDLSGNLGRLLRLRVKRSKFQTGAGNQSGARAGRQAKAEIEEARFADWAKLLFDQALLAEGGQLEDLPVLLDG